MRCWILIFPFFYTASVFVLAFFLEPIDSSIAMEDITEDTFLHHLNTVVAPELPSHTASSSLQTQTQSIKEGRGKKRKYVGKKAFGRKTKKNLQLIDQEKKPTKMKMKQKMEVTLFTKIIILFFD